METLEVPIPEFAREWAVKGFRWEVFVEVSDNEGRVCGGFDNDLTFEDTTTIEVDLPDSVALFILNECFKRSINPNTFVSEAIEAVLDRSESDGGL